MRAVIWYFDFVSPFACICLHRLKELPPPDSADALAVALCHLQTNRVRIPVR